MLKSLLVGIYWFVVIFFIFLNKQHGVGNLVTQLCLALPFLQNNLHVNVICAQQVVRIN